MPDKLYCSVLHPPVDFNDDYKLNHLDWKGRQFNLMPWQEIALQLANISEHCESLDLSDNFLGAKAGDGFKEICEALPQTLKALNLSANNLVFKACQRQQLTEDLKHLPCLVALNLSKNGLYRLTAVLLGKMLGSFSPQMSVIDLSANDFHRMSGTDLGTGLAGLSPGITSVKLTDNHFDLMEGDGLADAIKCLPKTVKTIDLSHNDLGDEHIRALLPALGLGNITSINLYDNHLSDEVITELRAVLKANLDAESKQPQPDKRSRLRRLHWWSVKGSPSTEGMDMEPPCEKGPKS